MSAEKLRVAGPWHTRAMLPAASALERALRAKCARPNGPTWVVNRTGRPLGEAGDPAAVLAGQFTHPVRWTGTLGYLARQGVADYVTAGPGKILRALLRRTLGAEVRVYGTEDFEDFSRTVEALCPAT
jgi:malonyl CoA-acyl carrier protein transacylase